MAWHKLLTISLSHDHAYSLQSSFHPLVFRRNYNLFPPNKGRPHIWECFSVWISWLGCYVNAHKKMLHGGQPHLHPVLGRETSVCWSQLDRVYLSLPPAPPMMADAVNFLKVLFNCLVRWRVRGLKWKEVHLFLSIPGTGDHNHQQNLTSLAIYLASVCNTWIQRSRLTHFIHSTPF